MLSLKNLSDKELLGNLNKLLKQEHECTLNILLHLIEVENRKIYRSLGYSSMFVYCTEGLGYSESAVNRRICAARAMRRCPQVYRYIRDGRVNLSNLAIAWKYVTPALLEEIAGKSQKQVFAIVARFEPKIKYRDTTRLVVVKQPVDAGREYQSAGASSNCSGGPTLGAQDLQRPKLGEIHLRCGGKKSATDTPIVGSGLSMNVEISTPPQTETVKMHQVSCLLDDAVMQDLDRCKELLSGKYPEGVDFNTLLKELAAEWLNKNDPVERDKRRKSSKKTTIPKRNKPNETSRYIGPAVRDAVYKRDGGRCTFVGTNGKRCNSKWDLEIHHDEVPFAWGGNHTINNLKLLCAAHNKLEAERVYGVKYTKKYDVMRETREHYIVSDGLTPDDKTDSIGFIRIKMAEIQRRNVVSFAFRVNAAT